MPAGVSAPPIALIEKMSAWSAQLTAVNGSSEFTDAQKKDLMQTITQAAVDATVKVFTELTGAALDRAKSGGAAAAKSFEALPYLQDVGSRVESLKSRSQNIGVGVVISELLDLIMPMQKAYNCL